LTELQKENLGKITVFKHPETPDKKMLRELFSMSGLDALNRILEQKYPQRYIQQMSSVDFFWLIKKIGEDDALPILKLASPEQWQYLLDMELWRKDRIDQEQIAVWLERLHRSDPGGFIKWFGSHGQPVAYLFMLKNLQVEVKKWDEDEEFPEDFITYDGTYFVRILNKEHEEMIGNILREMARDNHEQYQALILGLAGILPAEAEEGMYRMRNVRLAEEGFLPVEEALSVYAYQKVDTLIKDQPLEERFLTEKEETKALVPMTPLIHSQDNHFFAGVVSRLTDPLLLDRIRFEFAGLCNQILSADGFEVSDFTDLIQVTRKAAGYISLGLERVTDGDLSTSEQLLKQSPLLSIFRVGFGLALELKWEAERWMKEAWFHRVGFKPEFWGEEWGAVLSGLLQRRPIFFRGHLEKKNYREFEQPSDIQSCKDALAQMIALDRILENLTSKVPLSATRMKDPLLTFHPLPFIFWARSQLKLEPGFAPLSMGQARTFFKKIRGKAENPPYRIAKFKEAFIRDLMSLSPDCEPEEKVRFRETLALQWKQFEEEYEQVREEELDARFSRFIWIESSGDETIH
jgi:hypothetical protein